MTSRFSDFELALAEYLATRPRPEHDQPAAGFIDGWPDRSVSDWVRTIKRFPTFRDESAERESSGWTDLP